MNIKAEKLDGQELNVLTQARDLIEKAYPGRRLTIIVRDDLEVEINGDEIETKGAVLVATDDNPTFLKALIGSDDFARAVREKRRELIANEPGRDARLDLADRLSSFLNAVSPKTGQA